MTTVPTKRTLAALAALGTALLAPGAVLAQSKVGTTVGQFLGIEPSARSAAMGNAGAGLARGIESVYYNPGAIGVLERPAVLFTHSPWYAEITYDYVAAALPVEKWGTLFASVTVLDSGEIDVRTVNQPAGTGERFSARDLAIALGFGRHVTGRFAAGVQLNYVRQTIWNTSSDFVTFHVGTVYTLTKSGLQLGSCLSNLGTDSRFSGRDLALQFDSDPDVFGDNSALPGEQFTGSFPVPILFRVGLAYPYPTGDRSELLFAVDALHPNDDTESVNAGAEWTWNGTLALRAGYQSMFRSESELGLTFGVGLEGRWSEKSYQLDYAWADHDRLSETHRFTLVLEF